MNDKNFDFMKPSPEDDPADEKFDEEWKKYVQELTEVRDSVIQKARKKMGDRGGAWFMQKTFDFGNFIRENNRDYSKYVAYHKLGSSTTTRTESPKLDFPAPYNVKDFLMKLMADLIMMGDER